MNTCRQTRTKPNKKNQKYKTQLIGSLVASFGIFLMVMVAIVSLATSHSANSSKTSMRASQITTIISSIMSHNNYEELYDPEDIIIEGLETVNTAVVSQDIAEEHNGKVHRDNSTNVMIDNEDAQVNETLTKEIIKSPENSIVKTNRIVESENIVTNITGTGDGDIEVTEDELNIVIDPGDYSIAYLK
jgi:hypothetical protein